MATSRGGTLLASSNATLNVVLGGGASSFNNNGTITLLGGGALLINNAAPGVISITFKPQPPIDPMRIIELIQKHRHIKLAGNEKLRIEREAKDPKDRAQVVREVLRQLGQPVAVA